MFFEIIIACFVTAFLCFAIECAGRALDARKFGASAEADARCFTFSGMTVFTAVLLLLVCGADGPAWLGSLITFALGSAGYCAREAKLHRDDLRAARAAEIELIGAPLRRR